MTFSRITGETIEPGWTYVWELPSVKPHPTRWPTQEHIQCGKCGKYHHEVFAAPCVLGRGVLYVCFDCLKEWSDALSWQAAEAVCPTCGFHEVVYRSKENTYECPWGHVWTRKVTK